MNIKIRFGKANYKRIKPYLLAVDQQEEKHFRFTVDGGDYMPLSIEYLGYCDAQGHPVYSMMHYYTQCGDLMRDPDMTFSVNDADGSICPLTFQQDGIGPHGTMYQEVFHQVNGRLRYNSYMLHDLDSFLNNWTKNIQAQGFDPCQPFNQQETLSALQDKECETFHAYSDDPTDESKKAWEAAREKLDTYAKQIGMM